MATKIQFRRTIDISRINETPDPGEPLYTTDAKNFYIGDGSTPGGVQIGAIPGRIQDGDNDTYVDTANNVIELGGPWVEQRTALVGADINVDKPGFYDVSLDTTWSPVFSGLATPAGKVQSIVVRTKQDATGGWAIVWPANINWPGGVTPTASTDPNAVDYFSFVSVDNGTNWEGFVSGLDLS